MRVRPLLENWIVISVASVVIPPLGLLLLWIRPNTRITRKLVSSIFIVVIGFFYLRFLFGLRIETDGTGISPLISFYKRERHYARLEANRAQQKQMAPLPAPAEVQAQPPPTPSHPPISANSTSPISLSAIPASEKTIPDTRKQTKLLD